MNSLEEKNKYLMNTYNPLPIEISYGNGSYLFDKNNKKYIDFTSGIGVNSLGYNNQNWKNQKESPWWPTDGKDFSLNGKYICNWKNTKIKSCGKKYNEWKYLLLEVKPK